MNDKIAELRTRASADPKSRHFYPLGEELRKSGALEEAESVLREGLATHPNYLSAWISLGRVLRDQDKHREALEILQRAFSLDGSNVVTARLMAESYLALGDKLEAIKKFKLVRALLPPDEEIAEIIESLETELHGSPPPTAAASLESETEAPPLDVDEAAAASFAAAAGTLEEPEAEASVSREPEQKQEISLDGVSPDSHHSELSQEAERGPFDSFGDETLTRAAKATSSEEDPFGFGADDETGDVEPVLSASSEPFAEESPFGGETEPTVDRSASEELVEGIEESAPTAASAEAVVSNGRVMRLNAWLAKVRRNAGVS